jgi:hypothetical protein
MIGLHRENEARFKMFMKVQIKLVVTWFGGVTVSHVLSSTVLLPRNARVPPVIESRKLSALVGFISELVSSPIRMVSNLTRKHPFMKQVELEIDAHTHRMTFNPIYMASFGVVCAWYSACMM